jgi:hypothetical protein
MVALMTMGFVLLAVVAVSAVLLWAESPPRRPEPTVLEPRLTRVLLAGRDEECLRPPAGVEVSDRLPGHS